MSQIYKFFLQKSGRSGFLQSAEVAKIQKTKKIDLIVSGGAKGADTLARKYADFDSDS